MDINFDLQADVKGLVNKVNAQAASRAFRVAHELRNASLEVLKGNRSGRIYRVPFSKRTYQASAPGEPPAARTHILRRSWRARVGSEKKGGGTLVKPAITSDQKHAAWMQEGTPTIEPREFEQPILDKAKPKVAAIMKKPFL